MTQKKYSSFINRSDNEFYWFNEPIKYSFDNGLSFKTSPFTDFWQKTHYGFEKDDGHCYITDLKGDFTFSSFVTFSYNEQYDQCGLIFRIDKDNWVKVSLEYENSTISRLGSVVTNNGYSDWATQDVSSEITSIWYRVHRKGQDYLLEFSHDNQIWNQLRVLHLHKDTEVISIGVYACSPKDSSFTCKVNKIIIDKCMWDEE